MLKYVIIAVIVILFALAIYGSSKKSKNYYYDKEYSECYQLALAKPLQADKRINNFIEKCDATHQDYYTKGLMLKLFVDLSANRHYVETLNKIDLANILCVKGKFSAPLAATNGDSLYWLCVLMIKAHAVEKKDVIETIHDKLISYQKELDKFLELHLNEAIYASLSDSEDKGAAFYKALLEGKKPAISYDERILTIYKNTALAMMRFIGMTLDYQQVSDLANFEKTLIGKTILDDLQK